MVRLQVEDYQYTTPMYYSYSSSVMVKVSDTLFSGGFLTENA